MIEEVKVSKFTEEELEKLKESLERYKEINTELEKLNAEKKEISKTVTEALQNKKVSELLVGEGDDALIASYSQKITFKYTDEASIIKYLKDNKKESYLETSIIAPDLNADLKTEGNVLIEALRPYYEKNVSYQLSIMLKSDYDKNVAPKKKKKDS